MLNENYFLSLYFAWDWNICLFSGVWPATDWSNADNLIVGTGCCVPHDAEAREGAGGNCLITPTSLVIAPWCLVCTSTKIHNKECQYNISGDWDKVHVLMKIYSGWKWIRDVLLSNNHIIHNIHILFSSTLLMFKMTGWKSDYLLEILVKYFGVIHLGFLPVRVKKMWMNETRSRLIRCWAAHQSRRNGFTFFRGKQCIAIQTRRKPILIIVTFSQPKV